MFNQKAKYLLVLVIQMQEFNQFPIWKKYKIFVVAAYVKLDLEFLHMVIFRLFFFQKRSKFFANIQKKN